MLSPTCAALQDMATPALVVDANIMRENVDKMSARARSADVALRPHAKTHKTKQVAEQQLAAGAVGICCATVGEAEALSAAGIRNILITSPTFGADKFARVAKINRVHGASIVIDHPSQLAGLSTFIAPEDRPLQVLVDIDVGQRRTGVIDVADGVGLAKAIDADPNVIFSGVQGYAGHVQHIEAAEARAAATRAAADKVRDQIAALRDVGLSPQQVSGSGTGTFMQDAGGPFTELQVGSYVFMDAEYARVVDTAGQPPDFQPALFVLTTVVSANQQGEVTVDAGTKALATNGPAPDILIGAPPGSGYRFGGDEHGIISIPRGQPPPQLGSRILIRATHCDPTVNLYAAIYAISGDEVACWPVLGRHGT